MKRLTLAAVLWTGVAGAVTPGEELADPALEARARAISQELRCVVCQNQSIDDSDASLAKDLRLLLRERLKAGATDQEAKDYLVARYGHYVLFKPPFEAATLALWLGPLVALLLGSAGVAGYVRKRRPASPGALDAGEQARLDRMLGEDAR